MRFDVISLFPEMFDAMRSGIAGRAIERGQVELALWNPRDYADDAHRTVDDRPYGGGPGMVMMVEPLRRAIGAAKAAAPSGGSMVCPNRQEEARQRCRDAGPTQSRSGFPDWRRRAVSSLGPTGLLQK